MNKSRHFGNILLALKHKHESPQWSLGGTYWTLSQQLEQNHVGVVRNRSYNSTERNSSQSTWTHKSHKSQQTALWESNTDSSHTEHGQKIGSGPGFSEISPDKTSNLKQNETKFKLTITLWFRHEAYLQRLFHLPSNNRPGSTQILRVTIDVNKSLRVQVLVP